ncbi:MAG: hypothetical protein GXO48_05655 [Chlorobi bacterium]|nr:hypothetical protein [Chlorobiota bacterium]
MDSLGRIIKALSSGQKRHLSRWLKQNYSSEAIISLFEYISKNNEVNDTKIKKKFRGKQWVKYLPVVKSNLYKAILQGLVSLNYNSCSIRIKLLQELIYVATLMGMELYEDAISKSKGVLEKAQRLGYSSIAFEALHLLTKATILKFSSSLNFSIIEDLEGCYNDLKNDHITLWNNYFALLYAEKIYNYKTGNPINEEDLSLSKVLEHSCDLITSPKDKASFLANYYFIRASALTSTLSRRDYQSHYNHLIALNDTIIKDSSLIQELPVQSAYILHMTSMWHSSNGQFNEAGKLLPYILKAEKFATNKMDLAQIQLFYTIAFAYLLAMNPYNSQVENITENLETIKSVLEHISNNKGDSYIFIMYSMLKSLMISKKYDEAKEFADYFIKNTYKEKYGMLKTWAFALILSSLYYYKHFNSSKLNSAIRKAEYKFKQLNMWEPPISTIVNFIKNLVYKDPSDTDLQNLNKISNGAESIFNLEHFIGLINDIMGYSPPTGPNSKE